MAGKSDGKMDYDSFDGGNPNYFSPPIITEPNSKTGGFEGSDLFNEDYGNISGMEKKETKNELRQRRKTKTKKNVEKNPTVLKKIKLLISDKEELDTTNKNAVAFSTLTETITYFSFLVVLTVMALTIFSSSSLDMYNLVDDYFVTGVYTNSPDGTSPFQDMNKLESVWDYIENQILPGIFWNESVQYGSPGTLYNENIFVGKLRLRMLRVGNQTCAIASSFGREIKECAPLYSKSAEDKKPFGPANSSAFSYMKGSVMDSPDFTTPEFKTFGGGGYFQDLPIDKFEDAFSTIQSLKNNSWLDEDTRVIFIDFTIYNQITKILAATKIYIEVTPQLQVYPDKFIKTVQLFRYTTFEDFLVLVCEALFCSFIIFYLIREGIEIYKQRLPYFDNNWNIMDVIIVSLSLAYIGFTLKFNILVHNKSEKIFDAEDYTDISSFYNTYTSRKTLMALLICVSYFKTYKFLGVTKSMVLLVETFYRTALEILALTLIVVLIIFCFSEVAFLKYVGDCPDFATLDSAFIAFDRLIMGDFDYECMRENNGVFTPIFIITFAVIVFFILLNVYLAIISEAYDVVNEEGLSDKFIIVGILEHYWKQFLRFVGMKKAKKQKEFTKKKFREWQKFLQKCGYIKSEINAAFAKFDIKTHQDVTYEKQSEVEKFLAIIGNEKPSNNFISDKNSLQLQIESRLDNSIDSSASNLTTFVHKLDKTGINEDIFESDEKSVKKDA